MRFIKEHRQEVPPFGQKHHQRNCTNQHELQRIGGRNRKDIAHNDGFDRNGHRIERDHKEAQAEERNEDEADDNILFQSRALPQGQHRQSGKSAREKSAESEGKAEKVGPSNPRHHRMGERITDQRPALEHQIG